MTDIGAPTLLSEFVEVRTRLKAPVISGAAEAVEAVAAAPATDGITEG